MTIAHTGQLVVVEEDGLRKLALLSDEGTRSLEATLDEKGKIEIYAGGYAPAVDPNDAVATGTYDVEVGDPA